MSQPYRWDEAAVAPRLNAIARRVAALRSRPLDRASLDSVRAWYRIHHTYNSNAIEGNTLTQVETRVVVEEGMTIGGKPLKDHLEAVNLARALDAADQLALSPGPLTERELRELHRLVLQGIDADAGIYRRSAVRISGSNHPLPNPAKVSEKMAELAAWIAAPNEKDPVLASAIAHAWFVTIHPFVDGNGRTARLVGNVLLMKTGYPPALVQLEDRPRYFAAVEQSHSGELTAFILLVAEWVERTVTEYERSIAPHAGEPVGEYLGFQLVTA